MEYEFSNLSSSTSLSLSFCSTNDSFPKCQVFFIAPIKKGLLHTKMRYYLTNASGQERNSLLQIELQTLLAQFAGPLPPPHSPSNPNKTHEPNVVPRDNYGEEAVHVSHWKLTHIAHTDLVVKSTDEPSMYFSTLPKQKYMSSSSFSPKDCIMDRFTALSHNMTRRKGLFSFDTKMAIRLSMFFPEETLCSYELMDFRTLTPISDIPSLLLLSLTEKLKSHTLWADFHFR